MAGPKALHVTWKRPRDKYKVFAYRAFVKWEDLEGQKHVREVYDGNATSCVYSMMDVPRSQIIYIMAYEVQRIALEPILGRYADIKLPEIS